MSYPLITPDNCEELCGAGQLDFQQGGHTRILNCPKRTPVYGAFARKIDDVMDLIPRDKWPALIAEKDANHSWLLDLAGEIGCMDQDSLGYCHAYGTTMAIMAARAMAGVPYVALSAESIGGLVTNWRNEGADPEDDLAVAMKNGACAASYMDAPNSLHYQRWKAGWQQDAMHHKAEEVWDGNLPSKFFDVLVTCCLLNVPTVVWFNWWSHCISGAFKIKYEGGHFYALNRNSWGDDWPNSGAHGFFWMKEGYGKGLATPDGLFAIRVATPSEV